jgi:hypothetical protein
MLASSNSCENKDWAGDGFSKNTPRRPSNSVDGELSSGDWRERELAFHPCGIRNETTMEVVTCAGVPINEE